MSKEVKNTTYKLKADIMTQSQIDDSAQETGSIVYNETQDRFQFGINGKQQALGKLGWENHSDGLGTTASQVFGTTPALLNVDSLGGTTNKDYSPAPEGSELWDGSKITPIAVGDAYSLRVTMLVTAKGGAPNSLKMELDIGGSTYGSSIIIGEADSVVGDFSVPYTVSFVLPIFCLSTFLANGGQLWFSTDAGTLTVTERAVFLLKNF